MAINVTLFNFSKKNNSTAQPTGGTAYTCELKEGTSILTPTFIFNFGLIAAPSVNYAYVQDLPFARYYYITNMTYDAGRWLIDMRVDVLASWKTQIGLENCYVLRSAAASNGDIMDMLYPAKLDVDISLVEDSDIVWETALSSGTYAVGIVGEGGTNYYLMSKSNLDAFFDYIFSTDYADDLVANWASIYPELQAQMNPLQFISSVKFLPFDTGSGSLQTVRVGFVDVDIVAQSLSGSAIEIFLGSFTPTRHPQAASRGAYLNSAPYSRYTLFYPGFGMINLDPTLIATTNVINTDCRVDVRTGMGTLYVLNSDGMTMSYTHSQIGVDYQVSQVINKGYGIGNIVADTFSTAVGVATNAMIGNVAAAASGAISGINSGIQNALAGKIPSANTIGSTGSVDSLIGVGTLQCEFTSIVNENNTDRGRPLCENRVINTLSGYMLISNPDISIPATESEVQEIQTIMERGFFYE